MPRKKRDTPQPEPLVFPYKLRVGDVVLDEGARLEVVSQPTSVRGGKLTRVMVQMETPPLRHEKYWEAWRKVRVVRRAVA